MRKATLKRQLSVEIDKLPTEDLPRVLELVGKLNAKRKGQRLFPVSQKKLDPAKNSLRELLGIADVEPFAYRIDKALYTKHR